jgi:hypothetical protein
MLYIAAVWLITRLIASGPPSKNLIALALGCAPEGQQEALRFE